MTRLKAAAGREARSDERGKRQGMMRLDAYHSFKKCLFSGKLKPGQFVSQRELCELLAVPLNPIREAIRQLECEHLIRVYPQRGIQVIEADPKMINDAHDYRFLLESAAIAEFARKAPVEVIDSMLNAAKRLLDKLAARPDDSAVIDKAIEAAWSFHDSIIDFQDNAIISHHYRLNSTRIRLFHSTSYKASISRQIEPSWQHHVAILQACRARDVETAVRLVAEDIAISRNITLGLKA